LNDVIYPLRLYILAEPSFQLIVEFRFPLVNIFDGKHGFATTEALGIAMIGIENK
jgi:hypothetical protein